MAEMVTVRSVKNYFNEFIVKPAKDHGIKWLSQNYELVKKQILDAFRKEIFGQVVFKLGPKAAIISKDELAQMDGIQNILQQSFRKWRRLCILCSEYGFSFMGLEDLKDALEDDDVDDIRKEVSTDTPEGMLPVQ
jgi:hypothetical protein